MKYSFLVFSLLLPLTAVTARAECTATLTEEGHDRYRIACDGEFVDYVYGKAVAEKNVANLNHVPDYPVVQPYEGHVNEDGILDKNYDPGFMPR